MISRRDFLKRSAQTSTASVVALVLASKAIGSVATATQSAMSAPKVASCFVTPETAWVRLDIDQAIWLMGCRQFPCEGGVAAHA